MSTNFQPKFGTSGQPVSDVVWLQTSFIGDIILTTAAISALSKIAPNVSQHMITTAAGANALEGLPMLSSIHVFNKRESALGSMLKIKRSFKSLSLESPVTLQPHRSVRSTLLAKFLGFPTVTYQETNLSMLANVTIPRVSVMHETDRIALLLEGLGIRRELFLNSRPTLTPKAPPDTANFLLDKRFRWTAIAPGSVWKTKRWPIGKFVALAAELLKDKNRGIVLLGGKEDAEICNFIEGSCKNLVPSAITKLVNLAGKTSLQDLLGIYPYLDSIVTNDSSPVHYASAFNIPTLAIFGATVPSMGFGPLADRSAVAEVRLECRPCGDHGHQRCPLKHFKCMNDLSVEAVLNQFSNLTK